MGHRPDAELGWFYALTQRRPDVIARIGKTETELLDGVG
jgi:hypothetical protein